MTDTSTQLQSFAEQLAKHEKNITYLKITVFILGSLSIISLILSGYFIFKSKSYNYKIGTETRQYVHSLDNNLKDINNNIKSAKEKMIEFMEGEYSKAIKSLKSENQELKEQISRQKEKISEMKNLINRQNKKIEELEGYAPVG
jgi:cell shape-determining protein MreC